MVDSMITLYDENETSFSTNGLGNLSEAISCKVHEELNGLYELTLEYPIKGRRYKDLTMRRIIYAKPNPFDPPQPFRICDISKPLKGVVTYNARHISYDLSGKPVEPFSAIEVKDALSKVKGNALFAHNFTFESDFTQTGSLSFNAPCSTRALLGDSENGILGIFGGEYEWDKFKVILHKERGMNRGVSIRAGKNLLDLDHEEDGTEVVTGVYPYWQSDEEGLIELNAIVYANGVDNTWVIPLDCSSMFDGEVPTKEQLREAAETWIKENNAGQLKTNITLSFVPLSQSTEYQNLTALEEVHLGDTVSLYAEDQGIDCERKCVAYNYDVLTGHYDDLDMGDPKENAAKFIVGQNITIQETAKHLLVEFKIGMDSITAKVQDVEEGLTAKLELYSDHFTSTITDLKTETESQFTQMSDSFNTRVTNLANDTESRFTQMSDSFNLTVTGINNQISQLNLDLNGLQGRVTDAEGNIGELELQAQGFSVTLSGLDNKYALKTDLTSLTSTFATKTYVGSQITQSLNNIDLRVSGSLGGNASISLYSDGSYVDSGSWDLSNVRTAFANDKTAITISSGTLSFLSNTFVVTSTNFQVKQDGTVTAQHAQFQSAQIVDNNVGWAFPYSQPSHTALCVKGDIDILPYAYGENTSGIIYGYSHSQRATLIYATTLQSRLWTAIGFDSNIYFRSGTSGESSGQIIKADRSIDTTSDRDCKKDIADLDPRYLAFFDLLRPVSYRWINQTEKYPNLSLGFIAQEVEESLYAAGLTREDFSGLNGTNGKGDMSLAYEQFIPIFYLKLHDVDERLKAIEAKFNS